MKTLELIERAPISEELRAALLPAIAKAGPMKGSLLSDAPGANIAWQILVGYVAPARVKVWALMGADINEFASIDAQCKDSGLNWAKLLRATEPYLRWNCDDVDVKDILSQIEPHLSPAKPHVVKKRSHACVEALDYIADMIDSKTGCPGLDIFYVKEKTMIRIPLEWEGTKLRIVTECRVNAVRARADKLDKQIRNHKANAVTDGYKAARRARNWKPSMRVVPLNADRAAECGMEVVA